MCADVHCCVPTSAKCQTVLETQTNILYVEYTLLVFLQNARLKRCIIDFGELHILYKLDLNVVAHRPHTQRSQLGRTSSRGPRRLTSGRVVGQQRVISKEAGRCHIHQLRRPICVRFRMKSASSAPQTTSSASHHVRHHQPSSASSSSAQNEIDIVSITDDIISSTTSSFSSTPHVTHNL